MAHQTPLSATSLPLSPEQDRRVRMIKYCIAMGLRFLCFGLCFVTPGWLIVFPAVGAIVLPYLAMIVANVGVRRLVTAVERPGTVEARWGQQ